MRRVLILGGGFGGIAAARRLKQTLDEKDEIILVDRRDYFMVGFRKSWALVGQSTLEAGQRPLDSLTHFGIRVMRDPVTRIDPGARTAWMGDQRISADAMIVALGAELAPENVPGFQEHAYNVYDPQDIPRAAQALSEFQGGKLLIGVFGVPYKCPPAPYEMALLIRETLRARGVEADIEVFTPQPVSMPILGQVGCDVIDGRLADKNISFLPNRKASAVEAGEVVFPNERRRFDLLFGIPPHRPPAVVRESGLVGDSGWVTVTSRTLETPFPGVYAVGDVVQVTMANGKPLPKAGVFAESMGETAADHIAATFAGREPEVSFKGEGGCYLEVGDGQAMMVKGHFLAVPNPEVALIDASEKLLDEKRAFEIERLKAWFESA
ncbi:MAG TPA: FAD/NAD(P)-binding oxidoreductase [Anaerolineales bacterium]|nr:FAD/NAD(P)-binding oxidoreductase [Anaerolineales bacterium]